MAGRPTCLRSWANASPGARYQAVRALLGYYLFPMMVILALCGGFSAVVLNNRHKACIYVAFGSAAAFSACGIVVALEVPKELLVERAVLRRTDKRTGQIYHLKYKPPPPDADLEHRADDQEEVVRKRLDTYEAMTSDRIYRKAIGHERAMEQLTKYKGIQFDPKVVRALEQVVQKKGKDAFEVSDLPPINYETLAELRRRLAREPVMRDAHAS